MATGIGPQQQEAAMRTLTEITNGNLYHDDRDLGRQLGRVGGAALGEDDRNRLERFAAFVALNHPPEDRPYLLTFAFGYLLAQADIALHCPATLTGAVAWTLRRHAPPASAERFLPALLRTDGTAATGATWATEIGAGSDLGATATVARRSAEGIDLTGLKWFASNADADLALVTARPEGAPPGTAG